MSETPTVKGRLIAVVVGCVLLAVASEGILRLVMPHWREFYSGWFMRTIDVPGYGVVTTGRPGFDGYFAQNNGDFRIRIVINDFGLRDREPAIAADGRVWFVGDSMTFGWGVERDQRFSAVAGRLAEAPVYNVASPGTDVCGYQALVARMPKQARPRAVIVGLVLENDIREYDCRKEAAKSVPARMLGDDAESSVDIMSRRFLAKHLALYNFFAVAVKRVAFIRDGLTALGLIARGHAYRRAFGDAEIAAAVERTAVAVEELGRQLPGATPLAVLVVPGRFEIRDADPFYHKLRRAMIAALEKRHIAVIDPFAAFQRAGFGPTHFAHDGHWSPLGHKLAGEAVAAWLERRGLGG